MIKLQNNFTTPEQSKRLLELGMPADSADCMMTGWHEPYLIAVKYNQIGQFNENYVPCWSVGRLREIFCICSSVNGTRDYPFCNSQAAWWVTEFEFKKEFIDFTKLTQE